MTWAAIQSIVNYYYSIAKSSFVKPNKKCTETQTQSNNNEINGTTENLTATATSASSEQTKNKKFRRCPQQQNRQWW